MTWARMIICSRLLILRLDMEYKKDCYLYSIHKLVSDLEKVYTNYR